MYLLLSHDAGLFVRSWFYKKNRRVKNNFHSPVLI